MILHIINDDKFIDFAIEQLEGFAPERNIYLILLHGGDTASRYIKSDNKNIILVSNNDFNAQLRIIDELKFSVLFVHYLNYEKAKIINVLKKAKRDLKVVWFFWGGDGFSLQKFKSKLLQVSTRKIVLPGIANWLRYQTDFVIEILEKLGLYIYDLRKQSRLIIKVIKEDIDFIIPVVPADYYKLIEEYQSRATPLDWNYSSMEIIMNHNLDQEISGENILLGNSATLSNNHIEIIDKLSTFDLGDKKVYVPLSYGNTLYRDLIVSYGKKKLGKNFHPLVDFLPLSEYNKILSSCGYVIMNHNRQQAGANIITTLWMGAKVFINDGTTFYQYLRDMKIVFETIGNMNENSFQKLDNSAIEHNRKMLYENWGKETMRNKTKILFEILEGTENG